MKTHSKTPLFLMELVLMLLIFSLSAGICLQIFAKAKRISIESRELDDALLESQKAAEYWKATQGDLQQTAALLRGRQEAEEILVFYDAAWQPVQTDGVYLLQLSADGAAATIWVKKGERELCSFPCEAVIYGG